MTRRFTEDEWRAEIVAAASRVLDRIGRNLATSDARFARTADQRQALTNGRLQLAKAREVLGSVKHPLFQELVAEAIYRAASAMEQSFLPWALGTGYPVLQGRLKGGRAPKPRVQKRQDRRRQRVAEVLRSLPLARRTPTQVLQKLAEDYTWTRLPSPSTVRADIRALTDKNSG